MGREANCSCEVNGRSAQVKALIESPELILRGEIRQRIPFAKIIDLKAEGPLLRFRVDAENFTLKLGADVAAKWAVILTTPPPGLAKKLGITPDTRIRIIGSVNDSALKAAIQEGVTIRSGAADVIIARADTRSELEKAFERSLEQVMNGAHLWIVYRKGKGHPINENDVRETGLAAGIVDVKVAAISELLTGLKFVRRKCSVAK